MGIHTKKKSLLRRHHHMGWLSQPSLFAIVVFVLLLTANSIPTGHLLAAGAGGSLKDGYGSGIAKNTYSSTDPIATFAWLSRYLPVRCQDSMLCNVSFSCGTAGRSALCDVNDEWNSDKTSCTQKSGTSGPGSDFGLHAVNTTARAIDVTDDIAMVEREFTRKYAVAASGGAYDAFLDYATVLFAPSLDRYIQAFEDDGLKYLLLSWEDDANSTHFSVVIQAASSQIILELVSNQKPAVGIEPTLDKLQRLPAAVFDDCQTSSQPDYVLSVIAVSRGTSNMSAIDYFYTTYLQASLDLAHTAADSTLHAYKLSGACARIRFVERPLTNTSGEFLVSTLEQIKIRAHEEFRMDEFCGVDKWYDNHFAWDGGIGLDNVKKQFDEDGIPYHIFGDGYTGMTNMYGCDPTGECIQFDGGWINTPTGGTGDSLMAACVQGNCAKYGISASCSSAMQLMCPGLSQKDNLCTDCAYGNYEALKRSGCTNADVANICTNSTYTCSNKCDETGYCGQTSGEKCADLVKTYNCSSFYCPDCQWAGWCDKECGFNSCAF